MQEGLWRMHNDQSSATHVGQRRLLFTRGRRRRAPFGVALGSKAGEGQDSTGRETCHSLPAHLACQKKIALTLKRIPFFASHIEGCARASSSASQPCPHATTRPGLTGRITGSPLWAGQHLGITCSHHISCLFTPHLRRLCHHSWYPPVPAYPEHPEGLV